MGILTRYLIRAHAGPFFFALSTLTGLLFLNAVAQRIQDFAGKGLGWDIITDFLKLSLPHTIALTLPMAVLVAVLYAFSDLAANNEITAMKAGGISPQRLLVPLLGMGIIMALIMFAFNDQVLPESNHQLKNLIIDINRKSPTFQLREQVPNRIPSMDGSQQIFLQSSVIDNARNHLSDVVIVDGNDPLSYRWTVADSGSMHFNEARTDLYLVLFDGVMYIVGGDPPGQFRQTRFDKQIVPIRGIANQLEHQFSDSRSDREMNIDSLTNAARERLHFADSFRIANQKLSGDAVRYALGYPVVSKDVFIEGELFIPSAGSFMPGGIPTTLGTPLPLPEGLTPEDHATRRLAIAARASQTNVSAYERQAAMFRVEIHKKYSLAVACIVFVLIGIPIAVRFPRGGLGMVIAVSSAIFAVYWVGLIGGEKLADQGSMPPPVGMWSANVVFTLLGLLFVSRMGRESASNRGGGMDELLFTLRQGLTAPFRRARRRDRDRPGGERGAA
jgi:lipopolysaccharide export system permease protein